VRDVVSDALQQGVAVSFRYQAPDAEPTTRTVDPVRVLITDGQWYLQGWCHLRAAMRTFHLDRVSAPELTGIPITHADAPVPEGFATISDDPEVEVRIDEPIVPLLAGYLRGDDAPTADGVARARIRMSDPRGAKRVAARFGGRVEVTAPAIARDAVRDWAQAGLDLYGGV